MLRRLYDWCIAAAGKAATRPGCMGIVSFVESSFFPIPPDVMLIPMSLARPDRAYFYATVCTLTSVAGGVARLFHRRAAVRIRSAHWLIQLYGYGDKVEAFREAYAEWGAWIILLKGADADPLQDRHHHVRLRRLQLLPMFIAAVVHRARRAVLSARVPAPPLRPAGARDHRGAARLLGHDRRDRARRRYRRGVVFVLVPRTRSSQTRVPHK